MIKLEMYLQGVLIESAKVDIDENASVVYKEKVYRQIARLLLKKHRLKIIRAGKAPCFYA